MASKVDINFDKPREISCQAGVRACSINHKGDVYGCDLMNGIDELVAGNVKEQKFSEIWHHSAVFNKLRSITFDDISGNVQNVPYHGVVGMSMQCLEIRWNVTGL